jgi:hypothetical protein
VQDVAFQVELCEAVVIHHCALGSRFDSFSGLFVSSIRRVVTIYMEKGSLCKSQTLIHQQQKKNPQKTVQKNFFSKPKIFRSFLCSFETVREEKLKLCAKCGARRKSKKSPTTATNKTFCKLT